MKNLSNARKNSSHANTVLAGNRRIGKKRSKNKKPIDITGVDLFTSIKEKMIIRIKGMGLEPGSGKHSTSNDIVSDPEIEMMSAAEFFGEED